MKNKISFKSKPKDGVKYLIDLGKKIKLDDIRRKIKEFRKERR